MKPDRPAASLQAQYPTLRVTIEIPRGDFIKRGSSGHLDFVSPFPCPFNYGSVRAFIGGEGDYLDAVVLGPRLCRGATVEAVARGAVGLSERGMYDDKLICTLDSQTPVHQRYIVRFFHFYAFCKGWFNLARGQSGHARCEGWGSAEGALSRAMPAGNSPPEPRVHF